ncbi:MAG TPA: hypothetical protein VGO67_04910 [Verrucomicrobiae bacterium]|jgi:hypothetical protein
MNTRIEPSDGSEPCKWSRRSFLKLSGLSVAALASGGAETLLAKADISGPSLHSACFLRAEDLAQGVLEFYNLEIAPDAKQRRILRPAGGGLAHIVLSLPPQHLAEEPSTENPAVTVGDNRIGTFIADRTRLVFVWDPRTAPKAIPYTLSGILAFLRSCRVRPVEKIDTSDGKGTRPGNLETYIEWPSRLLLTPTHNPRFYHLGQNHGNRRKHLGTEYKWLELWHSGLDLRWPPGINVAPGASVAPSKDDEKPIQREYFPVFSIGQAPSNDVTVADLLKGPTSVDADPRGILVPVCRNEDVKAFGAPGNADFDELLSQMQTGDGVTRTRQMVLSGLGASADVEYRSLLNREGSLRQWLQRTALGRDNYIRVVHNGWLFPFLLNTVEVQIWERKFVDDSPKDNQKTRLSKATPVPGAFVLKRTFLIILEPEKSLPADDTSGVPAVDQIARGMHLSWIRVKKEDTQTSSLFNAKPEPYFPAVAANQPFVFHCETVDRNGRRGELAMQMMFARTLNAGKPAYSGASASERTAEYHSNALALAPESATPFSAMDLSPSLVEALQAVAQESSSQGLNLSPDAGRLAEELVGLVASKAVGDLNDEDKALYNGYLEDIAGGNCLSSAKFIRSLRRSALAAAKDNFTKPTEALRSVADKYKVFLNELGLDKSEVARLTNLCNIAHDIARLFGNNAATDVEGAESIANQLASELAATMEATIRHEADKVFDVVRSGDASQDLAGAELARLQQFVEGLVPEAASDVLPKELRDDLVREAAQWQQRRVSFLTTGAQFLKNEMTVGNELIPDVLSSLSSLTPAMGKLKKDYDNAATAVDVERILKDAATELSKNHLDMVIELARQPSAARFQQVLLLNAVRKELRDKLPAEIQQVSSQLQDASANAQELAANISKWVDAWNQFTPASKEDLAHLLDGLANAAPWAKDVKSLLDAGDTDPGAMANALKSLRHEATRTLNSYMEAKKEAVDFLDATRKVVANADPTVKQTVQRLGSKLLEGTLPRLGPDPTVIVKNVTYTVNAIQGSVEDGLLNWERHLPAYESVVGRVPSIERMVPGATDLTLQPYADFVTHGFCRRLQNTLLGVRQGLYAKLKDVISVDAKDIKTGLVKPSIQIAGVSREIGAVIGTGEDTLKQIGQDVTKNLGTTVKSRLDDLKSRVNSLGLASKYPNLDKITMPGGLDRAFEDQMRRIDDGVRQHERNLWMVRQRLESRAASVVEALRPGRIDFHELENAAQQAKILAGSIADAGGQFDALISRIRAVAVDPSLRGLLPAAPDYQKAYDALAQEFSQALASINNLEQGANDFVNAKKQEAQAALTDLAKRFNDAAKPFISNLKIADWIPNVKLLGAINLSDVIADGLDLSKIPKAISRELPDHIETNWRWTTDLKPNDLGIIKFNPASPCQFRIQARTTIRRGGQNGLGLLPPETMASGEMDQFSIEIASLINVSINRLSFQTGTHISTRVTPIGIGVDFLPPLSFIGFLQKMLQKLTGVKGLEISIDSESVRVGCVIALPTIGGGAFTLTGVSIRTGLTIPLGDGVVAYDFSFCDRDNRFLLIMYGLAGSGYLTFRADTAGNRSVEGALDFGGALDFNVGVAEGRIYAMGGVYFHISNDATVVSGYFRIGGRVSVLALLEVSIEIMLALTYQKQSDQTSFYGQGSIVVRIKILFFKTSVRIAFEKRIAGSGSSAGSPTDSSKKVSVNGSNSRGLPALSAALIASATIENPISQETWDDYCAAFVT